MGIPTPSLLDGVGASPLGRLLLRAGAARGPEPMLDQIDELDRRFRRLNAAGAVALVAVALWSVSSKIGDAWLLLVPAALVGWYGVKQLLARRFFDGGDDGLTRSAIPLVEMLALTALLGYLAVKAHTVPLALTLLFIWPLHRFDRPARPRLRYGMPALVFGAIVALHRLADQSAATGAFAVAREAAVPLLAISLVLWTLDYHARRMEYLDRRARLLTPPLWDQPYQQSLAWVAATALEQSSADCVVLHATLDGEAVNGRPVVRWREGVTPNGAATPIEALSQAVVDYYRQDSGERTEQRRQGCRAFFFEEDHRPSRYDPLFARIAAAGRAQPFIQEEKIRSAVAIALAPRDTAGNNVLGVLWLYFRDAAHFGDVKRHEIHGLGVALAGEIVEAQRLAAVLAKREKAVREQLIRDLHDRVKTQLNTATKELDLFARRTRDAAERSGAVDERPSVDVPLEHVDNSLRLVQDAIASLTMIRAGSPAAGVSPWDLQGLLEKAWAIERPSGDEPRPAIHFPEWDGMSTLPQSAEDTERVYGIVAQAIRNAVKHSRAADIVVTLRSDPDPDWFEIEVRDDGVGFEVPRGTAAGHGITIMRDRAGELGGRLAIESSVGGAGGTCVTLRAPRRGRDRGTDGNVAAR